jgi:hypothetical protein
MGRVKRLAYKSHKNKKIDPGRPVARDSPQ